MTRLTLVILALMGALASLAHGGTIRYHLDRTIGAGTVTGWIDTDGTTGALSVGNIVDYELTVSAPNLRAGPTVVLTPANQGQLLVFGSALTATSSTLSYDFGASGGELFLIQGDSSVSNDFWCLESLLGGCTSAGQGENIGFASDNSNVAQSRSPVPTGVEVVATAEITYTINREIGNGFVSGTITTNGTIGALDESDIVDWQLDLYAPGMEDGAFDSIDLPTSWQTLISGTGTIATATEIRFDFGAGPGAFFLMQGFKANGDPFGNYYCVETSGCTGGGQGEHIGQDMSGSSPAETEPNSGVIVIATVAGPSPITYTINREVGAGHIWGTITTNGSFGVLRSSDIVAWDLTLCAPNLAGGGEERITSDNQLQTFLEGDVTLASSTDLMFDIEGGLGTGFFLLQGDFPNINFYCIETDDSFCTTEGRGEHLGQNADGSNVAQTGQPTGVFTFASVNPAPITYTVQRRIAAGTVTGTITTDGTLGTLATANIIDFNLALQAPNLEGGPNQTITTMNAIQFGPNSTQLSASPTGLFFDISGASGEGFLVFQNNTGGTGFGHYWCIETAAGNCTALGQGEYMGFSNTGATAAQAEARSGVVQVATTCPADLNGDGSLDFFDVSAFLQALMNSNPIADFTGDGMYDFFDVSAFLQQLQAGCPGPC